MTQMKFNFIDNYIYLYQYDEFLIIPIYPETITDSMNSTFTETNVLSRSAPLFAYSYSGPRTIQLSLVFHRDMINDINVNVSNLKVEVGDDYIDTLIKRLQSVALPKYSVGDKSVEPPMVAVRFGNDIFIKGVVNNGITVTYSGPILSDKKYAVATISFTVSEIDPYDSQTVYNNGSFRGLTAAFKNGVYK